MNGPTLFAALVGAVWLYTFSWTRWSARRQRRVIGAAAFAECVRVTRQIGRIAYRIRRLRRFKWIPLIVATVVVLRWPDLPLIAIAGLAWFAVTTVAQWTREQVPASIIVLGASGDDQIRLQAALRDAVLPYRPISLLQTDSDPSRIPGDCFRIDSGVDWRDPVFAFCRSLPCLVLDARHVTDFVRDEIDHVIEHNYLHKTLFIGAPLTAHAPGDVASVPDDATAIRFVRHLLFERETTPYVEMPIARLLSEWSNWQAGAVPAGSAASSPPAGPAAVVSISRGALAPFSYRPPAGWLVTVTADGPGQYGVTFRPPDERRFLSRRSRLDFMVFRYPHPALPDEDRFVNATYVNLKNSRSTVSRERIGVRAGARSHECHFQKGLSSGLVVRFIAGSNEYLIHWFSIDAAKAQRFLPEVERFLDSVQHEPAAPTAMLI